MPIENKNEVIMQKISNNVVTAALSGVMWAAILIGPSVPLPAQTLPRTMSQPFEKILEQSKNQQEMKDTMNEITILSHKGTFVEFICVEQKQTPQGTSNLFSKPVTYDLRQLIGTPATMASIWLHVTATQ
jgi:hypothetical protein